VEHTFHLHHSWWLRYTLSLLHIRGNKYEVKRQAVLLQERYRKVNILMWHEKVVHINGVICNIAHIMWCELDKFSFCVFFWCNLKVAKNGRKGKHFGCKLKVEILWVHLRGAKHPAEGMGTDHSFKIWWPRCFQSGVQPREEVVADQLLMVNLSHLIMVGWCCYTTAKWCLALRSVFSSTGICPNLGLQCNCCF
jgi:hypothetical protein